MAKAKKLKSGNWRVLAYVGKDVTKSGYKSFTAATKKEAERLAAAYEPPEPRGDVPDITVGQAIDEYIAMKDAVLSPSTIRSYRVIRRNWLQGLMDIQVYDLTQADVQRAVNREAASGKSPKTLRNAHGLLRAAVDAVRPELMLRTVMPQKKKPDIKIPTKEEIDTLIDAADPELANAIRLAAMLGLRRSEICALTPSDFNEKAQTVTVNKAIVLNERDEWTLKSPKSYAGFRTLSVPSPIVCIFTGAQKESVISINPDVITHRFEHLQLKCFGEVRYRFHDLRHYNASVMLALGVPNKYAMERMGHATDNMLKAVYQHTMKDKRDEIASQLERFFASDTTQNTTRKA